MRPRNVQLIFCFTSTKRGGLKVAKWRKEFIPNSIRKRRKKYAAKRRFKQRQLRKLDKR